MSGRLERPIFFIGMPRSGTTILFEAIARHSALGWLSNYSRTKPLRPAMNLWRRVLDNGVLALYGHKRQYGEAPFYNIWLPQPDEAYEFWNAWSGIDFARDSLAGQRCAPAAVEGLRGAVNSVVRWQGRSRFAAKLTGPPRMTWLSSVFPDALFLHIVRDGRAVTHSLLNVPFWRAKGGYDAPFWTGLLDAQDLARWEAVDRDPGVLAALQWCRVLELSREEGALLAPGRYLELRYEDFTADPHRIISEALAFCGLRDEPAPHKVLDKGPALRNMNAKFSRDFEPRYLGLIEPCLQPALGKFGYS